LERYYIIHGDIRDAIKYISHDIKGILITDPPYPELEPHRAIGTTTRLVRKWFPTLDWDELEDIFGDVVDRFRECHIYIWANARSLFNAKDVFDNIGVKFWNILVWYKKKLGMGYHYRNVLEYILFFEKGKRRLNDLSIPNLFMEKVSPELTRLHPTAKPINTQAKIIENSAKEGDVVIDPFMGIGTTLLATIKVNRRSDYSLRYIGVEIIKEYVDTAIKLAKKYDIKPHLIKVR